MEAVVLILQVVMELLTGIVSGRYFPPVPTPFPSSLRKFGRSFHRPAPCAGCQDAKMSRRISLGFFQLQVTGIKSKVIIEKSRERDLFSHRSNCT